MDPSDQIAVMIAEAKLGYWIDPKRNLVGRNLNVPASDSGAYTIRDFLADQKMDRGIKHELAHRFTETLFPSYHSWFDEGLAMYASGELGDPGYMRNYKDLKTKGKDWWVERNTPNVNPGHLIGSVYFTLLRVDYGMTPEQNRTALGILKGRFAYKYTQQCEERVREMYELQDRLRIPRERLGKLTCDLDPRLYGLSRDDIQQAYEKALGVSLMPLFKELKPGVDILYNVDGPMDRKVRDEF